MYQKAILHLDMDTFFASVEIRKNSTLAGLPVPVGGTGSRGVITSGSYGARRFGIHAGMPTAIALRRCPDARLVRGNYEDRDLAYELRRAGRVTARLTVKLRYTIFNTYTRSARIPHTAHDGQLLPMVERLFRELFTRRQCVRLIGVRFDRLATEHTQWDLFADRAEAGALLGALDRIRGVDGCWLLVTACKTFCL